MQLNWCLVRSRSLVWRTQVSDVQDWWFAWHVNFVLLVGCHKGCSMPIQLCWYLSGLDEIYALMSMSDDVFWWISTVHHTCVRVQFLTMKHLCLGINERYKSRQLHWMHLHPRQLQVDFVLEKLYWTANQGLNAMRMQCENERSPYIGHVLNCLSRLQCYENKMWEQIVRLKDGFSLSYLYAEKKEDTCTSGERSF